MSDGTTERTGDWVKVASALQVDPWAMALVPMLRLHWFIRLRWIFVGGALGILALERFVVPGTQRPTGLVVLLIILAMVNLCWLAVSAWLFQKATDNPAALRNQLDRLVVFANAQVAVDLLLLTGILRYTGGAENPLAIFFLFHMAIVSLLLRRWHAILQGVWAITLYSALVVLEWRGVLQPHYNFLPNHPIGVFAEPLYVLAMILIVGSGIFGTLYFTLHIAGQFQTQERQLQQANAALQQSQRTIKDLQRRRSRFMQTAAHQLKAPLAAIQTMTDLIRTQTVGPEAVPGICDKVIRRCQEGLVQVGELLTLARVQEADPARHRQCEANVPSVVQDLCGRLRPLADDKQIRFETQIPADSDLNVCVDPRDLADCLGNLIENAIKYTPAAGQVSVTVLPERADTRLMAVLINVSDSGIGLDPSLVRKQCGENGNAPMFEAFRRGANVMAAGIPGTGLGLSIVREVVEQAGGRILVTSDPGHGTSFSVTFPSPAATAPARHIRDTRSSTVVVELPPDPQSPERS